MNYKVDRREEEKKKGIVGIWHKWQKMIGRIALW